MKIVHITWLASIALILLMISACGSGQGGNNPDSPKSIIRLSTSGTPTAKMAGIGITISLPPRVIPAMNPDGTVASTVIEVTGVAASGTVLAPTYTPAASSSNSTLHFTMASSLTEGFGTGEFATITLNSTSGITPAPSDFHLSSFAPISITGIPVNGLNVTVN